MIRGTRHLLPTARWFSSSVARSHFTLSRALVPPTLADRHARKPSSLVQPQSQRAQCTRYSTKADKPPSASIGITREQERRSLSKKLEPSIDLSTSGTKEPASPVLGDGREPDISRDLAKDLHNIQEAMALSNVPRESYMLGLAGTLPYLATSLGTAFLSWNINTPLPTDSYWLNSVLLSHESAARLLEQLELVQVGYGAVIISFLGAIHWGLEYAEARPSRPRTTFRYGLGLAASVAAWPTVMLPVEWALTSQFLAFTGMYFADARATARGWAPAWYATYRFLLTAIVGASLLLSLVARAKAGHERPQPTNEDLGHRMEYKHRSHQDQAKWARLEAEERERNREKAEEEERRKEAEQKKEGKSKGKKGKETENGNSEDKEGKEGKGGESREKEGKEERNDDQSKEKKQDEGK